MPLDQNIAGFLQFIEAAGQPPISESTVEQARLGLRTLAVDLRDPATLPPVGSVEPITLAGSIPARVYRPEAGNTTADTTAGTTAGTTATVVYLHGGGFVIGDLDTHESTCRLLCRDTGAVVVSVDYRLAPEHPFPAAVDDAWAALTYVAEHIADFGGDTAKLVVGGDSAGGNLAAVCALLARDNDVPVAAQLLVYPAVDLLGDYPSRVENAEGYFLSVADMHWFAQHYLGVEAEDDPKAQSLAKDPRLSPLHAATLAGLAPAIVATAEFDPLRDEGDAYAAALREAGVPVEHKQFPGLIHGFYGLELLSPAIAEASAWINGALKTLLG